MMKALFAPLAIVLLSSACTASTALSDAAPPAPPPAMAPAPPPAPAATRVKDRAALQRLLGNGGIALQWISWDQRGELTADYATALLRLHGGQVATHGAGKLALDGIVTEIGADYFTFVGRIDIRNTPDVGRACPREGEMTFRITENRKYWRLQQMEACDGLTDYVDIYF